MIGWHWTDVGKNQLGYSSKGPHFCERKIRGRIKNGAVLPAALCTEVVTFTFSTALSLAAGFAS
ncbi:hypothetical protein L228DRAFT_250020 [Xylona heveae TC161]|uniref:Uncharacterized protein n=1 Tax=Xylona heveae (strain CBS 132557 / TC161) TaxID=1328760 RepID=A0A165AED3_XYLHT|nr:hypothetical protein L228DRAFT_250020 [Xylona heveae TC161]KZF20339.1 hypothetical protein L228DRAFT_250020 [Xylona heveae TC161]